MSRFLQIGLLFDHQESLFFALALPFNKERLHLSILRSCHNSQFSNAEATSIHHLHASDYIRIANFRSSFHGLCLYSHPFIINKALGVTTEAII
jgi:hypothetical protein